jgi:phosphoribosyl-ATP pyrophosphohydrolase
LPLGEAVSAPLAGEGPWPTVVCDEAGRALGLVWSTRESIALALRERRGIYWSRSRRSLWRKGETSGAVQELVRVDLDCDRDALRFVVRQQGSGFCHRGTRACWDGGFGLDSVERLIQRRLAGPADQDAARSGTRKLAEDPALLRSKLIEEAGELAQAQEPGHLAEEAADLFYMALVALNARGADLRAVEATLELRSRRVRRRAMTAKPEEA